MSPDFLTIYNQSTPESKPHFLRMHQIIKAACPDATEILSYGMPAFRLKTNLCYFAVHKNHLGFYPTGSGIESFKEKIPPFKFSKGAIQFPYSLPLPEQLIMEIVKFRVEHCR
ncbi:MAG: iron chaperone [Bacteroidota bacterium]|jgi:uncharacterized protein YdhG (YjbR/CyaY superfamily)